MRRLKQIHKSRINLAGVPLLLASKYCVAQNDVVDPLPDQTANPSGTTVDLEPVIVIGIRASRTSVQNSKREQIEIVDSIVAYDIDGLPDGSVGEALKQITGTQIARDKGESDNVAIRGLSEAQTNHREIFTAGAGRTLNYADIPAELIARIDAYETSLAAQTDGGIGRLLNLRTFRLFEFKFAKRVVALRQIVVRNFGAYFPVNSNIGNYLVGNPSLFRDSGALRSAVNVAGSSPSAGYPRSRWTGEETTRTGYAMAHLRTDRTFVRSTATAMTYT